MELILTLLAALIIGLCLGLFGSGGSIMTVPVLLYLLKLPEKIAIASALGVVALISFVALIPYLYRRHLQWVLLVKLALPGMLGAWVGSWASHFVAAQWQLFLLALLMSLSALNMWQQQIWQWPIKRSWQMLAVGFLLGSLTGFVGVGGGFLIVPLLLAVTSLTMSSAIATSLALVLLQSSVGFIGHYQQLALKGEQLDLTLIGMLGGLGALGSILALALHKQLPQSALRRVFALMLLGLGASLLWRHFL